MDSTVQYDKHYAANRFRRTRTTGSRRYGAAREWRKKPTARELADSAGHAGHLFQERFKGIVVQKETHFLAVCRYVVSGIYLASWATSRLLSRWVVQRIDGRYKARWAFE